MARRRLLPCSAGRAARRRSHRPDSLAISERLAFFGWSRRAAVYFLGPGTRMGTSSCCFPRRRFFSRATRRQRTAPVPAISGRRPRGWEQILVGSRLSTSTRSRPGTERWAHGRDRGLARVPAQDQRARDALPSDPRPGRALRAKLRNGQSNRDVSVSPDHIANVRAAVSWSGPPRENRGDSGPSGAKPARHPPAEDAEKGLRPGVHASDPDRTSGAGLARLRIARPPVNVLWGRNSRPGGGGLGRRRRAVLLVRGCRARFPPESRSPSTPPAGRHRPDARGDAGGADGARRDTRRDGRRRFRRVPRRGGAELAAPARRLRGETRSRFSEIRLACFPGRSGAAPLRSGLPRGGLDPSGRTVSGTERGGRVSRPGSSPGGAVPEAERFARQLLGRAPGPVATSGFCARAPGVSLGASGPRRSRLPRPRGRSVPGPGGARVRKS